LVGETVRFSPSVSFGYEGLRGAVPEYNFVDGFWIGQRLMFSYRRPDSRRSLQITPAAYYATARRAFIGQLDATFRYAPLRHGELTLTASDATADYAGEYATARLINALSSLLFAENASRLYRRQTVGLTHRIDVAHGLRLSAGLHVERRSALANATSYSVFGGRGSIWGSVCGVLTIGVLNYALRLNRIPEVILVLVTGLLLIGSVVAPSVVDAVRQRLAHRADTRTPRVSVAPGAASA